MPEKEGHIEIYDCESYISWVKTQVLKKQEENLLYITFQPSMVLHELSHGIHLRLGEKTDNLIETYFLRAKQTGNYENVWYWNKTIR